MPTMLKTNLIVNNKVTWKLGPLANDIPQKLPLNMNAKSKGMSQSNFLN